MPDHGIRDWIVCGGHVPLFKFVFLLGPVFSCYALDQGAGLLEHPMVPAIECSSGVQEGVPPDPGLCCRCIEEIDTGFEDLLGMTPLE